MRVQIVPAGLPENITEAIIQEIFERCGEITTLRLSKKNFCHIRFVLETSVDAAIYLSGYRVRIGSSGDSANTGRLHVDFAQVRVARLGLLNCPELHRNHVYNLIYL